MTARKKTARKKGSTSKASTASKKTEASPTPDQARRLKALGPKIDALGRMRARRLEIQRKLDEMKGEETKAKVALIKALGSLQIGSAAGAEYQVSRGTEEIVQVNDWAAFYGWIFDNRVEDVLQHRPVASAVMEHLAAGEQIPQVQIESIAKLNLSKRRRN